MNILITGGSAHCVGGLHDESTSFRWIVLCTLLVALAPRQQNAEAKSYIAYISDSTNSSVIYWIAKEAGLFKKHGLDLDTIFINGSVRGIQSLIAGDLGYSGAVGTAVINARLAGADIAIIQSQMNTLPYFIIGNASISLPKCSKGGRRRCTFPAPRRISPCGWRCPRSASITKTSKRSPSAAPRPGSPRSPRGRRISPWSPMANEFRVKRWA